MENKNNPLILIIVVTLAGWFSFIFASNILNKNSNSNDNFINEVNNNKELIDKARESAKVRSAELVVVTVKNNYFAAYTKKGGVIPTLSDLKNDVEKDLSTLKSITNTNNSLIIVTTDGVTCKFVVNEGILVLENNTCNGISIEENQGEIGTIIEE